jgi:hypothetical protein
MYNLGIGIGLGSGGGISYIPQAKSLFDRYKAINENPDNAQKIEINEFLDALVTAGVYAKLDNYYKLDAHTDSSSLLNIINTNFNATKLTASPPAFTQYKGFKGNGTGGLSTGYNLSSSPTNFTNTSCAYGFYVYDLTGVNLPSIGGRATNYLFMIEKDSSNKVRAYYSSGSSQKTTTAAYLTTEALVVYDYDGTNMRVYINGLKIHEEPVTMGTFPNAVAALFGYYNSTTFTPNTTGRGISDAFWGGHLTDAEHLAMYDAIAKYQLHKSGNVMNTTNFLANFPYAKTLNKLAVCGDSIMANELGGSIPVEYDEGDKYRPIRLTTNSIARRIYDKISTNKATHIRLDADEWTKSSGWAAVNDTTVFEPVYTNEKYHESTTANSYVEIVVPDGQENFSFICQKDENYDTLAITLNGGDISTYGSASVNCARTRNATGDIGNPYFVVKYENLPAGANTIRIAKGNNTNKARIWGGFYWHGNTIVVHNVAHGGHNIVELNTQHTTAELVENSFDGILFELPIINELSNPANYQTSIGTYIAMRTKLAGLDVLWISPNPLGTNPINQQNIYETFTSPTQEKLTNYYNLHNWRNNIPFVDLFNYYKTQVVADGGTLADGDAGIYTHDGTHPNIAGVDFQWNILDDYF